MADEPPVGESGPPSRRPLNINEANVSNVKVTRMDVNTGEIKELQTDLLKEICECIEYSSDKMTKTIRDEIRASKAVLKKALQENRKAIVDALKAGGGSRRSMSNAEMSKRYGIDIKSDGTGDGVAEAADDTEKMLTKLTGSLEKMQEAMIIAAEQQAIRTNQGGQESVARGRGISEVLELTRNLENFNKITNKKLIPTFEQTELLLRSGFSAQREQIIDSVYFNLQAFGASLIDVRDILDNFRKIGSKIADTFDIAQTGIADTTDIITDSFKQLGRVVGAFATDDMESLRDSIRRTGEFIVGQAAEGRGTQFLLEGSKSLEDAAKFLRDTRNTIQEDFNFRRYMSDDEANVAILELLELQKRAGIMGEISASELAKRFVDQNTYLARIARDTGLSVEQLRKMTEEDKKQLANLEALSVLNREQKDAFIELQTRAEAAGAEPLKLLINQLAQSGNDIVAFAANFPDVFEDMMKLGLEPQLREITELVNQRDEIGSEEFDRRFVKITETMTEAAKQRTEDLGGIVAFKEFFKTDVASLIGSLTRITELDPGAIPSGEDTAKSTFESVKDLFKQFFPSDEVGLIRALTVNTAAILANTFALVGGGAFKKILGMFGLGGGAAAAGGAAATGGAAAAGGGLAAGGAAAAGGLTLPILAALLGGFGVAKATGLDEWINEAGVTGSGTIGTFFADMFGSDATTEEQKKFVADEIARIKSRRKGVSPSSNTLMSPTAAQSNPVNDPVISQLMMHTERLTSIEGILTMANEIHGEIRDTIGTNTNIGDTTGPNPVQRYTAPLKNQETQAYEPALDVSP